MQSWLKQVRLTGRTGEQSMGSFNENHPDRDPKRGLRNKRLRRAQSLLGMESLEQRQLLAFAGAAPPAWHPTSQNPLDATNGPLANAGPPLIQVYQDYQNWQIAHNGKPIDLFTPSNSQLMTKSGLVGVEVSVYGDTAGMVNALSGASVGMYVTTSDSHYGLIDGYVSPANLLKLAQFKTTVNGKAAGVVSLQAMFKPITMGSSTQAVQAMQIPAALQQYPGIDGSGVTLGILSDSINQYAGGLNDSVTAGAAPALSRINVLQDGPAGSEDEGRAMLEVAYDVAPGANFAFHTAFIDDLNFAQGIKDLSNAGAQVIVDDVAYFSEPAFQVGPIEAAVSTVVNTQNRVYFSSARNSASDGYMSSFRSVNATVGGTAGTWMNFDPNGGVTTQLPVTVTRGGYVNFQFDQPFYTSSGVSSQVNVYFLDSNNKVVASGTANNIATQVPQQQINLGAFGGQKLTMAVQVVSGSAPAHIFAAEWGGSIQFSQQFGSAGGTSYPTSTGHNAPLDGIGVGAIDVRNIPPFSTTTPIPSEDFSSAGPRILAFDANGNAIAGGAMVLQRPQISAPDGIQTTFFIQGYFVGNEKLPSFYGTSCAAPDAAALAVLMRQLSPGTPQKDILAAMIDSTISINGKPAGTGNWDAVGGAGLIQAPKAFADVSQLQITTTTPANGDVLTSLGQLQTVTVNFNKAVNPATIKASDLVFSNLPAGVTVTAVSVQAAGSTAVFTVKLTHTVGSNANGSYTYTVGGKGSAILGADGKPLKAPYTAKFTVADTIMPTILGTDISGRTITIQFSEPMDPATVTPANFKVLRGSSLSTDLSLLPGYTVTWYPTRNGLTNVAVIDMTTLPQTALPSDHYAIEVLDTATDLVGNELNGVYNGIFPTGDISGNPSNFLEDLGQVTLQAPYILSLTLDPTSDTGIAGDSNTNQTKPKFVGQVASVFPQAIAGLKVVVQFNALHNNALDLVQGPNGRGYTVGSSVDVQTTTDAQGHFSFQTPSNLPDGLLTVRVIVVGQADQAGVAGLSAQFDKSIRVDTTSPIVSPVGIAQGSMLNNLDAGVSLAVTDPVLPNTPSPIGIPVYYAVPALDPATATNVSYYRLLNVGSLNGSSNTTVDYSSYIISASYTDTTNRTSTTDPYTGKVDLKFAPGLPAGHYKLIALGTNGTQTDVTDAAGNPLDGDPNTPGAQNLVLSFDLQPTPSYITNLQALSPDASGNLTVITGPKDYYEVPAAGQTPRAPAPPTRFYVDFSGPLNPNLDYSSRVQLVRSADSAGGAADGNFGTNALFNSGNGYTRVTGLSVKLVNSIAGAAYGQPGYLNRLQVDIKPGTTLPADYYRIVVPNTNLNGQDLRISDLYGNQVDGEFLGNPTANGSYLDLLPNGQNRSGLSGDGVAGGSFETAFLVAANGNVIFARSDYSEDPYLPSTYADGSPQHPYPVLAPQALPNALNGGNLNSPANFGTGFNPNIDISGAGHFDLSAFYAASQLSKNGPVVIVAMASNPGDPLNRTFVLRQPAQDPTKTTIPDGSASIPANTMLVMQPGSILKMYNASLFVQKQGSAIQLRGGANSSQQVIVTSYYDSSAGGNTANAGVGINANAGDYGGILLRNFDDTSNGGRTIPIVPGPDDPNRPDLYGQTKLGLSGADEALSYFNFATMRYGGGAVPNTLGYRFDAITLFNTRPSITNLKINGGMAAGNTSSGSQAGISVDMDSLREDALARGALIRATTVTGTSINGIYVRAELNGVIEPTNSLYLPDNASGLGGAQNYTFDDPLPYIFTARMVLGKKLLESTGLQESNFTPRLYVQPGMLIKFQRGAAIDIVNSGTTLNVGDRTYFNEWDQNPNLAPTDANFRPEQVGDARILFTSFFDDAAATYYTDPITGVKTQIIAPLDSDNGGAALQPTPGNVDPLARWGSISVTAGARVLIDEADLRYGGGSVNNASGTIAQRDVLFFQPAGGKSVFGVTTGATGQRAYITNNSFSDNLQAPIGIDANGLLSADPLRPFQSGNPFFRGNVMQGNDINGVEVYGSPQNRSGGTYIGYPSNLSVDSIWDDTDVTYVLQTTIVLEGWGSQFSEAGRLPTPPTSFGKQLQPYMSLTLQSALPDTLLANGERIGKPGESLLVKMLNDKSVMPVGDGINGMPSGSQNSDTRGGAGFLVGFDDGVDPTNPDPLIDPGMMSQIRITGIGGNETTGQRRVPVIITSARDNGVGRTVRGVTMDQAMSTSYLASAGYTGASPAAGDGGVIGFGGLSLSDYNLYDPRDGNVIDNADIRFMTRIDIQGGGWAYSWGKVKDVLDQPDAGSFTGEKTGVAASPDTGTSPDPWFQYNTSKAMTISNSNLSDFSQVGVIAHPSGVAQIHYQKHPDGTTPALGRGSWMGEGVTLLMVNNTLANMPTGVRINSETQDSVNQPSPYAGVFQNNTFYNTDIGIRTQAPAYNGQNSLSHVYFTALDNIFANNTTTGIQVVGQAYSSQALYNLFSNTPTPVTVGAAEGVQGPFNAQPILGNAGFTDPTKGDFTLTSLSDAIDASLSEIKQSNWGTYLKPIATQSLTSTPGNRTTGGRAAVEGVGGLRNLSQPGDIVTLPGLSSNNRGFYDQWVPVLANTPGSSPGAITTGNTFWYTPISGERDSRGYLRVDDPNKGNVGFGSRPFFDIGANEYRRLVGPQVTSVQATLPNQATIPVSPTTPNLTSIYVVNGIGGVNQSPTDVRVHLNQQIDPSTINNLTVLLQASGGDGIFGNANNSQDRFISLAGKVGYDPGILATATTPAVDPAIIVHLGDLGLNLSDDLYRITVEGSGSNVVTNAQGLALDGENTVGAGPDGVQQALPSGNGIPGGNFFVTFLVKTSAPSIVTGTFTMAPDGDNYKTDPITKNNKPTFTGTIFDTPPPTNPLIGATVAIDISTKGYDANGNIVWDVMNAGTGTTDATGNFAIALTTALPDTNYNVGPDGILGTSDDSGYSVARVRIISTSGNQSSLTDLHSRYSFVVDTKGPQVTASDPVQNTRAVLQTGGIVSVAVVFPENIDPLSLTTSTIKVVRSGGDGIFGNTNDITVSIDPASIKQQYLKTPAGASIVRFNLTGITTNDLYQVTLVGSGTGVSDIAGNLIDGETPNGLPSGDGKPGGDYKLQVIVLDPKLVHTLYVDAGQSNSKPTGNRTNAFTTIGAAITAANIGDTVAVVGGSSTGSYVTYTETVNLKSLVQVVSADPTSTDTKLVPGIALKTVIKPSLTAASQVAVVAKNLISLPDFPTRISGFDILNSYTGGTAYGAIQPNSIGISISNSDILVDRNIITTSGSGVAIATSNVSYAPRLYSNVIVGNINGILVGDDGTTSGFKGTHTNIQVVNNSIAWNTHGVAVATDAAGPVLADLANNIFWQNAERTVTRAGAAITVSNPNRLQVRNNLFSANGPSLTSPADDTYNVGGGFNPALLLSTKTDALGNYTGDPAFVAPLDPRPDGQGLGNFFQGANYNIAANSAAIDDGTSQAVTKLDGTLDTDFLYRGRVNIPNVGFNAASLVDVGAYEFNGTNAQVSSLVQTGGNYGTGTINTLGMQFGSGISVLSTSTTSVTIQFASAPDRATVKAEDLLLSGPALNPDSPAQATSVTWINSNTARFNLSSPLITKQQLQVDFAPGALKNANGTLVPTFSQGLTVSNVIAAPTKPVTVTKPTKHPVHPKVPKTPVVVSRFTKSVHTPKV